ncbi:MAG: hypothetical protein ABSH51_02295 [Solirubrobacteraceae bacterium]
MTRPRRLIVLGAAVIAVIVGAIVLTGPPARRWYVLRDPIDPRQLTELPFGTRSHWLQPWRSSLTTRPATALQDAIGINFDVTPAQAGATARLLADSGVRRVRIEFPWSEMSYAQPTQISPAAVTEWTAEIDAFRRYHLRPLILLNGNSGMPGPGVPYELTLAAPAPAGATTVQLTPASASPVVPGLTGFNVTDSAGYPMAAGVIITSITAAGAATLSRPLPAALAAGPVPATTLRYAPFSPPQLADGSPNPRFEQTLAGWLGYVKAVCDFVRSTYGSDEFDVEVWNELSFGSAFLNESDYFSPVPDPGATGSVDDAILAATVSMLADPNGGLTGVRVGDGFANSIPWVSGATVPPGTAAIDHHPYSSATTFPAAATESGDRPLDALGRAAYRVQGTGATARDADLFVPHYTSFFPEYYLTGIQTETLMRDLSPLPSLIDGTPHGAATHPPGAPAPANWITETNLSAAQARGLGMPAADIPEFQAKVALRDYLAYASEGAQAIDLYATAGGACCQLIAQRFLAAAAADPGGYPGDGAGGRALMVVRRMLSTIAGAQPIAAARQLTLEAIASDNDGDVQFAGDGTTAFPSLYNRDVLAFFPFEVDPHRFVSAVYVMTRDLARRYTSRPAPGQTPYDLPAESFRLTIGNLDGRAARVSLLDPLTGSREPVTIVSRAGDRIVVALRATDSPRMLTIDL